MKEEKEVIIPAVPSEDKRRLDTSLLQHPIVFKNPEHIASHENKTTTTTKTEEQVRESAHDWSLQEKLLKVTCTFALVLWVIVLIFLSIITDSSLFNTFVGLSPFLLTIVVSYLLVDRYHMESGFLMVFPFIFVGVFLVLGYGGFLGELGVKYEALSVVNLVAGLFFEAVLVLQHSFITKHGKHYYKAKKEETKTEGKTR